MIKREILSGYFNAGLNDREIARELNLNQATVWKLRRKLGFKPQRVGRRSRLSDELVRYACLLLCDEDKVVAARLGCSITYLNKTRRRLGIGPKGVLMPASQLPKLPLPHHNSLSSQTESCPT